MKFNHNELMQAFHDHMGEGQLEDNNENNKQE